MLEQQQRRRVVITGLGAIAPNGIGTSAFWSATSAGTSGITPLDKKQYGSHLPIRIAGQISDFFTEEHIEYKTARRTDRMTHFALASTQEALTDAQLDLTQEQPDRVGAVIANTMGGIHYVLAQLDALYTRGPRAMSPFTTIAWLHVANTGQISIKHHIQGYCKAPINDSVGSLDALCIATAAIRRGAADIIITGGCEAFLHPFVLHILAQQGHCVTADDTATYRPFDRRASGLILAEGAGICILEAYEHAQQRGAPIYGEILGYGQTSDASGPVAPSNDGTYYARALQLAMRNAHIQPPDVSYISLDGHALPDADAGEIHALQLALETLHAEIPVSVPRTTIGHSYAAAGALDTITTLLALRNECIPPTINCEEFNTHYEINLIRNQAAKLSLRTANPIALVAGRGIGGSNVALALRRGVE
ncbi:MAG TPA: beta-ketoacyl-[acyl-carrier-protein] synthase family protein [Dictyobacter sp.]|nr:beta-ketoacyl-[acyl-carrier-protein] synthase family protein [Dictyobacter sp.]